MPLYSNSAFGAPFKTIKRMDTSAEPNYLFGSFTQSTQPFRFQITQVAITSNVATVSVQLIDGGGPNAGILPSVGATMGIHGTQTNAGLFNVDPTTVTAVTLNTSGVGTISFSLTNANITAIADRGELVVKPYEIPDIVAAGSASVPIALCYTPDESDNSRTLYAEARWTGTAPTAASVVLQVANVDEDSRYAVVGNSQGTAPAAVVASSSALATIAASAVTQSGAQYSFVMGKFIRAKVLSMTGGDGTTGLVVTVFA